ncbi:hypothetical protein B0H14DRAFT_3431867 [Mycena olivaceomarginata]|nr:hypothetical protein B0H14DRAFT_3431867 [Mycena olivaceomarginata]
MAAFSALPIEIGDLILQQLPRRALVECCLVCRGILTAIRRRLYRRIEISAQQLTLLVNMSPRLAELVHEFTVADADHQLCNTTSTETLDRFNDNIATVLQSFKNIEHIRILVTLNPTSDLRFSHFDPVFLCTFPRLKAFVFTGNTRAVWQSSLINFLGRHPSVLQVQIRFPAVPSLPCYTMIERPPRLTYTRLTGIEIPITIFHMLDPYRSSPDQMTKTLSDNPSSLERSTSVTLLGNMDHDRSGEFEDEDPDENDDEAQDDEDEGSEHEQQAKHKDNPAPPKEVAVNILHASSSLPVPVSHLGPSLNGVAA